MAPALNVSTDKAAPARSPSPTRPPVSPITPPLAPVRSTTATNSSSSNPGTLPTRQPLTHTSQVPQVGIPAPAPEPLDFDSNPDAIALRSAISVLQVQSRRATADIQALRRAMDGAVAEPEAFIEDLAAGRVQTQGTGGFSRGTTAPDRQGNDGSSGSSSDEEESGEQSGTRPPERPWASLPAPQNVVRAPPINWSQYAVVGESLDKLHQEQVAQPSQGVPAVYRPGGTYEFRGDGTQVKYSGVATPYAPGKDHIEKRQRVKK